MDRKNYLNHLLFVPKSGKLKVKYSCERRPQDHICPSGLSIIPSCIKAKMNLLRKALTHSGLHGSSKRTKKIGGTEHESKNQLLHRRR